MSDERRSMLDGRASLLTRMRNVAQSVHGTDPARRVQLTLAMDRYLARLLKTSTWGSWVLKGGYANQLRAPTEARFTQDVDLKVDASLEDARDILAEAAVTDLADLFTYEFAGAPQPLIGPPGGGLRFPIRALLSGTDFVRFGADVNSRDAVVGTLERHPSDPVVVKLGYPRSWFPVYPIAQQFAEKLHALTLPRERENTRVKDLADMIWFIQRYAFASATLIDACTATFGRRNDQPWPPEITVVPPSWARPFLAFRVEMGLAPETAEAARTALVRFLEPVLANERGLRSKKGGAWMQVRRRAKASNPT